MEACASCPRRHPRDGSLELKLVCPVLLPMGECAASFGWRACGLHGPEAVEQGVLLALRAGVYLGEQNGPQAVNVLMAVCDRHGTAQYERFVRVMESCLRLLDHQSTNDG